MTAYVLTRGHWNHVGHPGWLRAPSSERAAPPPPHKGRTGRRMLLQLWGENRHYLNNELSASQQEATSPKTPGRETPRKSLSIENRLLRMLKQQCSICDSAPSWSRVALATAGHMVPSHPHRAWGWGLLALGPPEGVGLGGDPGPLGGSHLPLSSPPTVHCHRRGNQDDKFSKMKINHRT